MKRLSSTGLVFALLGSVGMANSGERQPPGLDHNPFSRPAILAAPAQQPGTQQPDIGKPLEDRELSATLVSERMPLVIIDGELLELGESIDGYRLVGVRQGKAVFEKAGKKHIVLLPDSEMEIE